MEYRYKPRGVCSSEMIFDIENDVVNNVKIIGGCPGNTIGLSRLIQGKKIQEIIELLKNIPCGGKKTSCPDQVAQALEEYKKIK